MNGILLKYFQDISPISDEEIEAINRTLIIQEFKKGDFLLREGDVSPSVYFVISGCVRLFYIVDGEEKTANFFTEGQWVSSFKDIAEGQPSGHFLDCCTDCVLTVGNRKKEEELYKKYPKLAEIAIKVFEKNYIEQQKLLTAYVTDTPEQRYIKLLKSRPELFQIIPQYQIASYIGVKPESLSRIRNRIAKSNL